MRGRHPKLSPDQIDEALKLESSGWTQHRIGERFGVSQAAISYHLRPRRGPRGGDTIAPNRKPSSRLRYNLPQPCYTNEPYSPDETEYLRAVADWQARTDTRFPTACDYRQILIGLGYRKAPA